MTTQPSVRAAVKHANLHAMLFAFSHTFGNGVNNSVGVDKISSQKAGLDLDDLLEQCVFSNCMAFKLHA